MEYALGKENEFGDGTERTEDTSINTTRRDGNQHPLDIPMVLPPSLLQCSDTVTPKTLSILTSMVVRAAHHQTPWESRLALVELNIEDTLGYKIAPWVM